MRAGNFWAVVVLLGLAAVSCGQDPIFQIIANETAPLKPHIEGTPTNMAVFNRSFPDRDDPVPIMYVASGRIYWYARPSGADLPQWDSGEYWIPQPGGKISALAVAKYAGNDGKDRERLYALCWDSNGDNSTLRYMECDEKAWRTIGSAGRLIQSIYADPEKKRLFAGAQRNAYDYDILYLDNNGNLRNLKDDSGLLSGAVYDLGEDAYYLSTRGGGIFQISESSLNTNTVTVIQLDNGNNSDKEKNRMFMGMIKLKDGTIIAVEREGGALFEVTGGSFARMQYTNNDGITVGNYATGALALWEDYQNPDKRLLVAGIQGGLYPTTNSSHTYGYVEFELNPDGSFNDGAARHDSNSPSNLQSIIDGNQERYAASLGKQPVKHLFQAPKAIDPNMTFFASTQKAGLWSHRNRPNNGGWQWNAEE